MKTSNEELLHSDDSEWVLNTIPLLSLCIDHRHTRPLWNRSLIYIHHQPTIIITNTLHVCCQTYTAHKLQSHKVGLSRCLHSGHIFGIVHYSYWIYNTKNISLFTAVRALTHVHVSMWEEPFWMCNSTDSAVLFMYPRLVLQLRQKITTIRTNWRVHLKKCLNVYL